MIIFPDISPEIFSISVFGLSFSVRWYALSYIVGILLAWRMALVALRRSELWPKNLAPMAARDFEDLLTWMILGILLGGRLGYVLFYQPAYYVAHPFEIVMIWTGGMALSCSLCKRRGCDRPIHANGAFAWALGKFYKCRALGAAYRSAMGGGVSRPSRGPLCAPSLATL